MGHGREIQPEWTLVQQPAHAEHFDVDTASSLTFTNRLGAGLGDFATSTANLSLDLPFAAQLTFGYVTQNQNWNASELHIDVLQSGSVLTSTSIDHSGLYYTNTREGTASLLVPAGVSTVSLSLDVSRTSGQTYAGGFWLLHEFRSRLRTPPPSCRLAATTRACWLRTATPSAGAPTTSATRPRPHREHGRRGRRDGHKTCPTSCSPRTPPLRRLCWWRAHCYLVTTPTTEGMPLCWAVNLLGYGWSDDGAIGDGYQEDASQMPDWPLPTGRHVDQIEAGWNHTCALFDDGSMGCWGDNTHGQLGTGNTSFLGDAADEVGDGLALVDLPADTTVTSMALGWDHTCVLYSTGDVACWGNNATGSWASGPPRPSATAPVRWQATWSTSASPLGERHLHHRGRRVHLRGVQRRIHPLLGPQRRRATGPGNTATYGDNGGETVGGLSAIDGQHLRFGTKSSTQGATTCARSSRPAARRASSSAGAATPTANSVWATQAATSTAATNRVKWGPTSKPSAPLRP